VHHPSPYQIASRRLILEIFWLRHLNEGHPERKQINQAIKRRQRTRIIGLIIAGLRLRLKTQEKQKRKEKGLIDV